MNEKLVQEAAEVMRTNFWKILMSKIREKRTYADQRYHDDITEQAQWIRHAIHQGEIKAFDRVLLLPDEIIEDAKEGKLA